jgi:hypothetical protein
MNLHCEHTDSVPVEFVLFLCRKKWREKAAITVITAPTPLWGAGDFEIYDQQYLHQY